MSEAVLTTERLADAPKMFARMLREIPILTAGNLITGPAADVQHVLSISDSSYWSPNIGHTDSSPSAAERNIRGDEEAQRYFLSSLRGLNDLLQLRGAEGEITVFITMKPKKSVTPLLIEPFQIKTEYRADLAIYCKPYWSAEAFYAARQRGRFQWVSPRGAEWERGGPNTIRPGLGVGLTDGRGGSFLVNKNQPEINSPAMAAYYGAPIGTTVTEEMARSHMEFGPRPAFLED